MRQRVETVTGANGRDALLGVLKVVQNAFTLLFQHPFVGWHSVQVLEQTTEGSSRISAKMGKLFYIFHLFVVLKYKILEAFRVGADGIEEGAGLIERIVAHQYVY